MPIDRVDRFAIATAPSTSVSAIIERINHVAFGFRAYPSREIAVETSRTFQVVSRFHRAIGVITIVASSVFLLCIMVLKVEERRRDIAALRLMGISRASVVRSIVIESALVAVLGCVLGVALGWAASLVVNWHYQALYRTPLQFSIVTAPIVAFAVALSLLLGIGAGLLASLRLVRTPPLQLAGVADQTSLAYSARRSGSCDSGGDAARHGDAFDRDARVFSRVAAVTGIRASPRP